MNRTELEKSALAAADRCLKVKRHLALVDVFLEMGKLSRINHDHWRAGRVPYLERVIELNLAQINAVCRVVHASARRGRLKPSWTAYLKRGPGGRPPLRFTKSGDPQLERHWATHYLHPDLAAKQAAPPPDVPAQPEDGGQLHERV
jgi:hypothetical protein